MVTGFPLLQQRITNKWSLASLLFLLLISIPLCGWAKSELHVSADRTQITLDESLGLMVRADEQVMFDAPDFSLLEKDFTIVSNSKTQKYQSINGTIESFTQWRLMLMPKRTGTLMIPALTLDQAASKPIAIQVSEPKVAQSAPNSPLFLEMETDKNTVHVQEQLLVTFRLMTSVNLLDISSDDFKIDNAVIKQVDEQRYQKQLNGTNYGVIEVTFAVFPQSSEDFMIPVQSWIVTKESDYGTSRYGRDPFLSRGEKVRLRSPGKPIQVKAPENGVHANGWLPAQAVRLTESWSQQADKFIVGEPITRTLTLQAKGLSGAQLPPMELEPVDGLKYYQDQPQIDEALSGEGVTGKRTESYAIVPTQPGNFTLPAIDIEWWDTQNKVTRHTNLPAQTITVAPPAGGIALPLPAPSSPNNATITQGNPNSGDTNSANAPQTADPQAAQPAASGIWLWIGLMSLLLNLLLLIALFIVYRKKSTVTAAPIQPQIPSSTSEKQAYQQLLSAGKNSDITAIRHALLDWGRAYAEQPTLTLQELGQRYPELLLEISGLEKSLYQPATSQAEWNAKTLLSLVQERRKKPRDKNTEEGLRPLY